MGITMHGYAAPIITTNLPNLVAISGTTASLQVSAYDTAPLNYQWYLNATNIPDATNASLIFTNIQTTSSGRYSVTVTNSSGSITSRLATVTVENYPNPTTIVAWGDNSFGQTNVPLSETNVVALAGGQYETMFLRRDGTVGDFTNYFISPVTLSLLPRVAAISIQGNYDLALGTDGKPVSFGPNLRYQCC